MTVEELIKALEKIKEGCINVSQEPDIHEHTRKLARLIIKDCNSVLAVNDK